ncbi:SUMF1/EgtB/PvdO family nonheme iron enzyme [Actinoplanes solisilvae]|uniref:SUMF1/EgtB/PvdO family nonheme iron enzyme n=1 Tax=Actinoplanes solisilvae TaxID=2486853 RepID=UPI000FD8C9F0|nr:SUMF1/EgtB/PvdO family nonheme iron enzyme [Actinoplanes solisilvae]
MTAPSLRQRPRFGIWSDSHVAADELQTLLTTGGQRAVITKSDRDLAVECLIVLTRRPPSPAERAVLTSLFNATKMTIAVEQSDDAAADERWPRDVSLRWTGQIKELSALAADLMNLVRPTGLVFSRLPVLLRAQEDRPAADVADNRADLVERLTGPVSPRVVRVTDELWKELREPRRAQSRMDYSLRRLAGWSADERSRAFVNLRLTRSEERAAMPAKPVSLDDVVNDSLTRPLVLLLGEPSAGKSLQLRYFDAHAALRSLRRQPGAAVPETFYVALSDQPARPDISLAWLRQRWSATVDVTSWCDFDQFLADGGTVLLDGLNEGGLRSLAPEEWMSQWRDVIQELFEHGAGRAVVSCRTRDQAVRMNVPRNRQPTSVTILPLAKEEIIAIATERDVGMARQLAAAFSRDPGLVELYSSPFALKTFLDSGTAWVATTGARLLGVGLSAAIVREWDHDNSHGRLVPGARASSLETIARSNQDPWPELEMIPLIRGLCQFAKELTLPVGADGQPRPAMSPGEAEEFLAQAIQRVGGYPVNPHEALETAKDLHVLQVDSGKVRFTHPSMQHLFAAVGCSIDELVGLAGHEYERPPVPPIGVPPDEVHHRYEELFRFAAQLRGIEVPDRLLPVDPILAAQILLTIRRGVPEYTAVRDRIVTRLRADLDTVFAPSARIGILAALGDLGWSLPSAADGVPSAAMVVPAGTWQLGGRSDPERAERNVSSEVRSIELPAFRISRFPVSNAEYAAFIDDKGYEEQSLWSPEGWQWRMRQRAHEQFVADWRRRQIRLRQDHPAMAIDLLRRKEATPAGAAALVRFAAMSETEMFEYARAVLARPVTAPRFWRRKQLGNRLQPVVGVSWFEANAYCAWLSRRLGTVVRLPSENEWEAACLRSWGVRKTTELDGSPRSSFGNTAGAGRQATTPIGAFATREQARRNLAVELMGNIFEWVFDYYAAGDHARRILKGGSWRHESWRAHPAYRGRGDVAAQNDDVGFRYVITEEFL